MEHVDGRDDERTFDSEHGNGLVIEPEHYASDAEFAAVAAFWELSARSFPAAVVPPPLVPMLLHAFADDPTTDLPATHTRWRDAHNRDPAAFARLVVPLVPAVTPRVQQWALESVHRCVVQRDRRVGHRCPFTDEALRLHFFARAAAVLHSAWGPLASSAKFQVSAVSLTWLLDILDALVARPAEDGWPARAIREGVFEPLVARLREFPSGDDLPVFNDERDESRCVRVMAIAVGSSNAAVRNHLRAIGAVEAIAARRSSSTGNLEALHRLMAAPDDPNDLPGSDALLMFLGRCLGERATALEHIERASAVLCNVIDRSSPPARIETLFAVPGVLERLYGGRVVSYFRWARELAVRCCLRTAALTEMAVSAGLLRNPCLAAMCDDGNQSYNPDITGWAAVCTVVAMRPSYADEAIRSGLPKLLLEAFGSRHPEVKLAATKCLTVAVGCCGADAASSSLSGEFIAGVDDALSSATAGGMTGQVHAAVVALLTALAAHDELGFALETAKNAPGLPRTLRRLRQSIMGTGAGEVHDAAAAGSDVANVGSERGGDTDDEMWRLDDRDQQTVHQLSQLIRTLRVTSIRRRHGERATKHPM